MVYLVWILEVLCVGLCCNKNIGILIEVIIRRKVLEMWEIIERLLDKYMIYMFFGSFKDGFRFKLLDMDVM